VLGYEILLRIKFLDGIWRINHIAILRDRLNWIGADYEEKEEEKKKGGEGSFSQRLRYKR
jgi:hypothetical protein